MFYLTYQIPDYCRQIKFEDLLYGNLHKKINLSYKNRNVATITSCIINKSAKITHDLTTSIVSVLSAKLSEFWHKYSYLADRDMSELYRTFYLEKASGGWRQINAPCDELATALTELKDILDLKYIHVNDLKLATYHTSAHAYIEKRGIITNAQVHQRNESNWFLHLDFSKFFDNTTHDFVMNQFMKIYPWNEFCKYSGQRELLRKVLGLCFLNGGLPQGAQTSPIITNIMMIPIDFQINKVMMARAHKYTRYADDIIISSRSKFDQKEIIGCIQQILSENHAPFTLNEKKTHFGSRAGRNWICGIMLNKDNELTIGHVGNKKFKAMLFNYAMDKKNGKNWIIEDVRHLQGNISYYKMVQLERTCKIINDTSNKVGIDILQAIKSDIRNL